MKTRAKPHKWTSEDDDFIRVHYTQTYQSAKHIANSLGNATWQMRARIAVLGMNNRTHHRSMNKL